MPNVDSTSTFVCLALHDNKLSSSRAAGGDTVQEKLPCVCEIDKADPELDATSKAAVSWFWCAALVALLSSSKVHVATRAGEQKQQCE